MDEGELLYLLQQPLPGILRDHGVWALGTKALASNSGPAFGGTDGESCVS